MKIKIRPDDATTLQADEWLQMNDWLAELREDNHVGPPAPDAARAEPPRGSTRPEVPARPATAAAPPRPATSAIPAGPATSSTPPRPATSAAPPGPATSATPARPATSAIPAWPATSATPARPATAAGPGRPAGPAGATVRAVIGDQLRIPITWCEMGCCISWRCDPAALGEGDARARALGADWRIDAFGRLACPRCQQTNPDFRASRPVVPWDRYTAIVAAARITACGGRDTRLPLARRD
jgi:hypothetical protein